MALLSNFTDSTWQSLESRWKSWWEGRCDDPMVVLECSREGSKVDFDDLYGHLTRYGKNTAPAKVIDDIDAALGEIEYKGDAFPRWWPNYGSGVLAAFLGSPVEFVDNTTWFHNAGFSGGFTINLEMTDPDGWADRIMQVTEEALLRWGERIVFGYPDIGGNLDVLASLFGSSELLMATLDQGEDIRRLVDSVTRFWIDFFRRFEALLKAGGARPWRSSWIPAMAPSTTYPLQCDFSIMIGEEMFKEFALPDLSVCCDEVDYPFYHLDGPGADRHLEDLLSLENLRGIQWIPGAGAPPAEEWIDLLGRIREGGKLCQVYVEAEGAVKICEELGGKGFLFCIGGKEAMLPTEKEGDTCLQLLASRGFYHG
jgi:hypothetical protein